VVELLVAKALKEPQVLRVRKAVKEPQEVEHRVQRALKEPQVRREQEGRKVRQVLKELREVKVLREQVISSEVEFNFLPLPQEIQ
jgi:hypothetical protein